ncbi:MFS general substrate transporter [Pholiota conissans]|uniref:MFS general substrate transporter n=1 Tax=Pholiota conissans TaxID=109636 RepID=A0A9P6CRD0_9AGAR|nr:MFS general substrate transporter [Pholiota conissans]
MNDENNDQKPKQDVSDTNSDEQPSVDTPADLPATTPPQEEYSRFTKGEKWFIVCFTSFVGVFSPLTANIYLPALPTLSVAFHKSTELINVTVTVYMVLQGVAPMLWGPVSDHVGRRPISATCLLILTLACIGLALVPTSDFWLLILLRCLQAAGSASTIAVGAGVVGDISTRAERGSFFGVFTIGPMVGPAIGPVIGGALSDSLGWRSLFWFLVIAAALCFVIIILFQPETLRSVTESSRAEIPIIYKPVLPIIGRGRRSPPPPSSAPKVKVPKNPFALFLNPDVDVLLFLSAIGCAVYYGIIATISTLFVTAYPYLTETTIGLCYLSIGGGMIVGSTLTGRILDKEYRRFKAKAEARFGEGAVNMNQEENFPLEKARLRLMPVYIAVMAACCAGYGWAVQTRVNIAVPLILHFIFGFTGIAIMNVASTLIIDLIPGQSSSVTACNNLIRCTLSAVLVSVIEFILKGIGIGWTYVLFAGILLCCIPAVYLSIMIGPKYRVKRQRKREEVMARLIEVDGEKKNEA